MDVPAEAPAGTSTLRVTARGGGAQDVLPIAIRVNAEAAGDITLTTSTPTLTGASDATFTFDLQYQNDTAQDVTVSVAATGPAGLGRHGQPERRGAGRLDGRRGRRHARTSPSPRTPARTSRPGRTRSRSRRRAGDRTVSADLGIEVTGSYSMTLSTPNDLLSASGSAGSPRPRRS